MAKKRKKAVRAKTKKPKAKKVVARTDNKKRKKRVRASNPIGRPRMFKTVADLEAKIDEYFKTGVKKKKVITGKGITLKVEDIPVPTMTGMALFLGFCDRQSLFDYEKISEFTCTIKKARSFIEQHYEECLQHGSTVGAIFALKNMGWKDSFEQVHDVTGDLAEFMAEISASGNGITIKGG